MHIIQDEYFLDRIKDAVVLNSKKGLHRVYSTMDHQIIKIVYNASNFKRAKRLAEKFIKNTVKLRSKNIKTVIVCDYKEFPEHKSVLIAYPKLPGKTILDYYKETQNPEWILKAFELLQKLHANKIFFHDFHAENIVFDDTTQELALIDVHSVKFPWFLSRKDIVKNFNTFFKHLNIKGLEIENLRDAAIHRYQSKISIAS